MRSRSTPEHASSLAGSESRQETSSRAAVMHCFGNRLSVGMLAARTLSVTSQSTGDAASVSSRAVEAQT
eukprot:4985153-Amphidinium_carterae.1